MNDIAIPIISEKGCLAFIRKAMLLNFGEVYEYLIDFEYFKMKYQFWGASQFKVKDMFWLNLRLIRAQTGFKNIDNFYRNVALTISHETTHLFLYELEGKETCKKFDNIAPRLRNEGYFV